MSGLVDEEKYNVVGHSVLRFFVRARVGDELGDGQLSG
jgi:hypothetical protein